MPRYFFITGSSGLLGSYLMRDCLRQGLPIAVLVRKNRLETARGRVETILARWEAELNCLLPRPVVLEGDICQPELGLDAETIQWVRQNCHSVVHSAASLSFELDEKTNEPWRSNLDGTRNVVEFAKLVGIKKFHQVSTAYVCGLRTGTILESELDVGQSLGNPYEESKLSSEKLVRETGGFDQLTVHRPAIIVGDSRTGYTTTYHGFYTPLKVLHMMVGKVPIEEMDILSLLQALGLGGHERKNFVPVDWVSAVMTHVLANESLHGQTYHLAPRTRVSIDEMAAALSEAIQKLSLPALEKSGASAFEGPALDEVFRTQMQTYQSYWRDDPEFDTSNTIAAAPHLPCPTVDVAMMWRLAKYSIENNFGWPVPPPKPAPFDVAVQLAQGVATNGVNSLDAADGQQHRLALEVAGPGGGEWTLQFHQNRLVRIIEGRVDDTVPQVYMSSCTFGRLATAETTATESLRIGGLVVQRAGASLDSVLRLIDQTTGNQPRPPSRVTNTSRVMAG